MDLGLLQREVAKQLGVHASTVRNWELGRTEPAVQYVPRILDFLVSFTLPGAESANDFPARLTLARRTLGLTQRELAAQLGVDEDTVWEWENGNHRPVPTHLEQIEAVFEATTPPHGRSRGIQSHSLVSTR